MKLGVKTFNNPLFLEHFKDKADFFEIMAIRINNYNFLKKFQIPMVIHVEHQRFGINIVDKSKYNQNLESINFAKKLADFTNSKKIILHPGIMYNENCSKENSINFIKEINDKRIIIENLIPVEKSLCTTPEETKEFLELTKTGFCFDINHAIETAIFLKQDYIQFIKDFIKLKPSHYHLGGQIIKENKTHLPLKESDFDLKEIIKLFPKDAEITLETAIDIKNTENDIILIKQILNSLK